MLKNKLLQSSYYENYLSLFLKNSFGILDRVNINIDILKNLDKTADEIIKILDVYNILNESESTNDWFDNNHEFNEEITKEVYLDLEDDEKLDLLASIFGISRNMKISYTATGEKIDIFEITDKSQITDIKNSNWIINSNYSYDWPGGNDPIIFDLADYTEGDNGEFEFLDKIYNGVMFKPSEIYDDGIDLFFVSLEGEERDLNPNKTLQIGSADYLIEKYNNKVIMFNNSCNDIDNSLLNWLKNNGEAVNIIQTIYPYGETGEISEFITLSNRELYLYILFNIAKINYRGTHEELLNIFTNKNNIYSELPKNLNDLGIYYYSNIELGESICSVVFNNNIEKNYLREVNNSLIGSNIYKLFLSQDLLIKSLGITYKNSNFDSIIVPIQFNDNSNRYQIFDPDFTSTIPIGVFKE